MENHKFLDELIATVKYVREHYPAGNQTDWSKVKQLLKSDLSTEAIRSRYRRATAHIKDERTFEQLLLEKIKTKRTLDWLINNLNTDKATVMATIAELQLKGYRAVTVFNEDDIIYVHNRVRANQAVPYVPKTIPRLKRKFAVVSDTHIGSMQHDNGALHKFYDIVAERGIDTVLHAGDIVDGYYPTRPTSIMEQSHIGFSNQLKEVVRSYPARDGVTTWFISGNHDYTYLRNGFADIGETIEAVRDDLNYLGHNYGKFWLTEDISISLIHPTDGISRNFNSKIRDIVERRPDQRGDLMFIGHYHKLAMLKHQGSYAYVVPAFQRQTNFMKDNGLESLVGGLIVEVSIDETGKIHSVTTEVIEL